MRVTRRPADHIPTCTHIPWTFLINHRHILSHSITGPSMDFIRICRRNKKKKPDSERPGSPPRGDTPSPNASIRSASPTSTPLVAVSALVFQPLVPLSTPPQRGFRQTETAIATGDNWTNLTAFLDVLHHAPLFAPLAGAIDDLGWFIKAHEVLYWANLLCMLG